MWTIIWIALGWMVLAVLMAWVWHRLRIIEYRKEYTEKEIWQDYVEGNLDETDEYNFSKTDSATFSGMDEAAKAMKEKLESILARDDPPEASPEDTVKGPSIEDVAAELVFGEET